MTNTSPWHSSLATDRQVYHDDTRCTEGNSIALKDWRPDTGGRPKCEHCARL
jgi:hypothetical protein